MKETPRYQDRFNNVDFESLILSDSAKHPTMSNNLICEKDDCANSPYSLLLGRQVPSDIDGSISPSISTDPGPPPG